MNDRMVHLKIPCNANASIDAYREYKLIVGDDDGGKTFTPEQYEEYKKRVLPQRMMNRLYTSWTNEDGMDCKLIGPETQCFCEHRYRDHKTDFKEIPTDRPIMLPCRAKNCRCASYHYIPRRGGSVVRCTCKHQASQHSVLHPYKCKAASCSTCQGFKSSYTCPCGQTYMQHKMIVETKDERIARGHPVGQEVPYQAMGGITGFSSLLDGYCRLDPSGAGVPSLDELNKPMTSSEHPFLKKHISTRGDSEMAEFEASMKQPGESELDYYERRYQQRLAVKNIPMASKTNVKWGNTAGFIGLTYLFMASIGRVS
ncbi:hypothetical protein HELRODRAFT_167056 [Helobdella robusta]|uniref:Protein FAM221A n=1 Tax=Helobdella robusta TaxID=6412 RepID=T1EYY6_HELRO|nr:hypothetical protein HELRODRAFT_167056 [Helobdella robusta]ESO10554.1 hypothetical protein HELRODRAFT_167056 [Helobdella robusta]